MKAIRCERFGGPDVLELVDAATPEPSAREVLVEVEAAGVNFCDVVQRRGRRREATPLPFIPGSEIVGRVCAVGASVTTLSVGDRVAGVTASRAGGYAERCAIAAELVARIDHRIDARRAVALPFQGATALHVLETMARLKLGDVVGVTAAAGGVGGLAVQLARHLGAGKIVAFASSATKVDHAIRLGADEAIDGAGPDLGQRLQQATRGGGFDVVLDGVGGELGSALLEAMAPFGRFVSYGLASGDPVRVASHAMRRRSVSLIGFDLDTVMSVRGWFPATVERLFSLVDAGALVPPVGLVVPLARAVEAHAAMERRATLGKVVLAVGDGSA